MSLCNKNPAKACGININNLKVWYKGGLNDISNNGYNAINIKGNIYNDINDCSVYGNKHSSFTIPYNINTTSYTIIYVGKYNGNNTERILTSSNNTNYFAGFWNGKSSGMCYQGGSITDFIDKSNNDWLISTSYSGGCRVNGTNIDNNADPWKSEFDPGTFNIGVNIYNNQNIKEHSDWKIYEILIFDTILSEYQTQCIENYLSQEHSIPIPSYSIIPTIHPTKTCPDQSNIPSTMPSTNPTISPTIQPSNTPSTTPSEVPSISPTNNHSIKPTISPFEPMTNQPSNYPTTNNPSTSKLNINTIITNENSNSDTFKFIILISATAACCVSAIICCVVSAVTIKKHHQQNRIMLSKHSADTNQVNPSTDQTISLPAVVPQPTLGNSPEYSENNDSEGVIVMPGDTITNNISQN